MGKQNGLVSVIIPAYNCGQYIAESLDSVFSQTYPFLEVIVIDDGSTDRTKEILERYRDRVIYRYQQNAGSSAAKNAGIQIASGDYLQFLDADDIIFPSKIEKQVSILKENPEYSIAYSKVKYFTDNRRGELLDFENFHWSGNIFVNLLWYNAFIPIHTALIRRAVIDDIGYFNKDLASSEDYEFWLRVASKGHKFIYQSEALCLYRIRGNSLSRDTAICLKNKIKAVRGIERNTAGVIREAYLPLAKILFSLDHILLKLKISSQPYFIFIPIVTCACLSGQAGLAVRKLGKAFLSMCKSVA